MSMQEIREQVPTLKEGIAKHKIKMPPVELTNLNLAAALTATKTADGKVDVVSHFPFLRPRFLRRIRFAKGRHAAAAGNSSPRAVPLLPPLPFSTAIR